MNTGSLRARVTVVMLILLALVLVAVIAVVTLAYRSNLQHDLTHKLTAAGTTVLRANSPKTAKELARGLALEGIATNIQSGPQALPPGKASAGQAAPTKTGMSTTSSGSLQIVEDVLADGTRVTFSASNTSIAHTVTRLLVVEIVVGASALALAALLIRRATKTALRPLSEVIETASLIADGHTELRLRPTRGDTELGTMATVFDQMVDSLETAASNAQSSEEAMRQFLTDASHELRTPVAAVQANAERLLREQPDRPQRDEVEASIARNAARLGRLVNVLLSLARLEAADHAPDDTVDLAELTRAAVQEARLRSTGPTIELETHPACVHGDATGLQQVIQNLVDNALAALPPRGHIKVTTNRRGDRCELRVADDGPGIPHSDRERIFERFVQLNTSQPEGTGLGLAIARRIARQHGGDLTCDPVPQGASFTLRLPCTPDEQPTSDCSTP
jgi:two-component system, OmpR family, sensor kinase